jgi:hypothetical protein
MQQQATNRRSTGYWSAYVLPRAASIVSSYTTGVTLRQLFYRLVSDGTLRNTRAEYNQLSSRTAAARRAGRFPELIDRTREIVVPLSWTSPAEARQALRDWWRRDRTEGQPWSIYLGVEKAGIIEQLSSWFGRPFGIPIVPLGGYHSESFEREINTHADGRDRPSVLLYAGDLDPSGEDIERNFLRYTDFDESKKVALTVGLALEHDLPPMLGKETDTRARAFVAKYGHLFQIEVDALPPDVLRDLFATAIADYWDTEAYERVVSREQTERSEL